MGIKEFAEAAGVLGPGRADLLDPATQAVHLWHVSLDERLPLHRAEMAATAGPGIVTGRHVNARGGKPFPR